MQWHLKKLYHVNILSKFFSVVLFKRCSSLKSIIINVLEEEINNDNKNFRLYEELNQIREKKRRIDNNQVLR